MQCWRQSQRLRRSLKEELSLAPAYDSSSGDSLPKTSTETALGSPRTEIDKEDIEKQDVNKQNTPSSGRDSKASNLPRGVKRETHDGREVFVVQFHDDADVNDAHTWSLTYKWVSTAVIGSAGAVVGWASSIDSGALTQGMEEFQISDVAQSLSTAVFLIAFGAGALFAAPFSETVGRNATYILTMTLFCIFTMASALAPNYGGLLAFRFISGFFAATPLVTFGGSTSDMWSPVERTYVFPVCACLSFLGPFLAPTVGAFIGQSPIISWRWVYWVTLIFGGLVLAAIALFMPETYGPVLLSWKAHHLRKLTGDDRYLSQHELSSATFWSRMQTSILRPFRLFVSEPMVMLFSLYLVVVYIILFGFLTGYTFIFGDVYHFSQGSTGLTYIGMNVGFLIAFMLIFPIHRSYVKKLKTAKEHGEEQLPPEVRLSFAIIGAPWLPISLFWMAWTAYPSVSYWSCLIATVAFGFATMAIFISTYLYLIDSYHMYAASALVGATLLRYIAAGVMVPVTIPMYKNLGVHWALTLLALISLLATPIPYLFSRYGSRIRKRSSFAE